MVASAFLPMLAPALAANPLMAAGANYTANRLVGNDHKSSLTGAVVTGGVTGVGNMAAGSTFMGGGANAGTNLLTGANIDPKAAIGDITIGDAATNALGTEGAAGSLANSIGSSAVGEILHQLLFHQSLKEQEVQQQLVQMTQWLNKKDFKRRHLQSLINHYHN